jgi:hypothetical protein
MKLKGDHPRGRLRSRCREQVSKDNMQKKELRKKLSCVWTETGERKKVCMGFPC